MYYLIIKKLGLAIDETMANEEGWLTISAPHRNDKNPSFSINIKNGGWRDNATGKSGDLISLVQLVNPGMKYTDAKAFVEGKQSGNKIKLKKVVYPTGLDISFWTNSNKQLLEKAQERLEQTTSSQVLNELKNYDGIEKKTLQKFGCGLINWDFSGETKEALLIPYPTGAQIYARSGGGKQVRMLKGSKPSDCFMGADHVQGKRQLLITKSQREYMLAHQERGKTHDVVGICSGETDKLTEKQEAFLKDKSRYYEQVFISFDRDTLPAEEIAFGFARKVCDAIGTYKRDIRLCNITKLTDGECKDLTDLIKSPHADKIDQLFRKNSYELSDYIWNSFTDKYCFWDITEKGRLEMNEVKFARVLGTFGFKKIYFGGADEPTLVQEVENVLQEVSPHQLCDVVLDNILSKFSRYVGVAKLKTGSKMVSFAKLQKTFFRYREKLLNKNIKAIFRQKQIQILTESSKAAFLFFKNSTVKVTKDKLELVPYNELPGKIWKSQVMHRVFIEQAPPGKGDFEQFVENISGGDAKKKRSFMSALGYLIHTYKNKAQSPAIVLIDENSSPGLAEGGTGKGIFAQSIKHIRKQRYIAAKNLDSTSRFLFMDVERGDQSLFLDDIKDGFDFEALFNIITDDMQVEAKHKNRFTISFEDSPKVMLSTNYVINGTGNSFERRQFILPFSNHYNRKYTPRHEFGRNLFKGWDEEEWSKYDQFMILCLQTYLQDGLIPVNFDYERKQLINVTDQGFINWADNYIELGVMYDLRSLFRGGCKAVLFESVKAADKPHDSKGEVFSSFYASYPDALHSNQQATFNKWLKTYADYKGWRDKSVVRDGYTHWEFYQVAT